MVDGAGLVPLEMPESVGRRPEWADEPDTDR